MGIDDNPRRRRRCPRCGKVPDLPERGNDASAYDPLAKTGVCAACESELGGCCDAAAWSESRGISTTHGPFGPFAEAHPTLHNE